MFKPRTPPKRSDDGDANASDHRSLSGETDNHPMDLMPSKGFHGKAEREQKRKRLRAPYKCISGAGHDLLFSQRLVSPIWSEERRGQLPEPWQSLQKNGLAAQRARGIGRQEQIGGGTGKEGGEEEGRRNAFELPRA